MLTPQILNTISGNPLTQLHQIDQLWWKLRHQELSIPEVIIENSSPLLNLDTDIVICGGTLGILIGTILQSRQHSVLIIERGILKGRAQEWNISKTELYTLVELGLLTEPELETAIASSYNPGRISFLGGSDIWVKDVLNIGVDPIYLLATLKQKFINLGGKLLENTQFEKASIHPDGVEIKTNHQTIKTRLLIDAMGHFSPLVQQARNGLKPDGICLVVGSCAQGFPQNETGDLIVSFTPIQNHCQYFWEAFPARDGRTTYLFTYLDAEPDRFSLQFLFEEYLRLLPEYQNLSGNNLLETLNQLNWKRALFGIFPAYRQSPIKINWPRIIPIGDSSANQSPLSFGGFGAMIRHLNRLTTGIDQALKSNTLDQLQLLQSYQPNISITWLFQKSMSVKLNQNPDPNQINQLLTTVFEVMNQQPESVLKPFLQDIIQFTGLSTTLLQTALKSPKIIAQIIPHVGLSLLLDWIKHYLNLGIYTLSYPLATNFNPLIKTLPPQQQYYYHSLIQNFKYGAGFDYKFR